MASPVRHSRMTHNVARPFSETEAPKTQLPATGRSGTAPLTALSIEFVAKPQEAHRVEATIPAAIAGAFENVSGFAGCLVMISDQEARLVTVVTLWAGDDRVKHRNRNLRWVQTLLAPYLDHCLRVQTMVAHLPVLPTMRPEAAAAGESSVMQDLLSGDTAVCVA